MASANKGKDITPSQFMGKSFEDCEKILGKPGLVVNPKGKDRGFHRYYKTEISGLTRIVLERLPAGSMKGPVPKTVNVVSYDFPRSTMSYQEALSIIGIDSQKAKVRSKFSITLPDGIQGYWDANSVIMDANGNIKQQEKKTKNTLRFQVIVSSALF